MSRRALSDLAILISLWACADRGVNGIKVGIGPGGGCTTRLSTNFGVPQVEALAQVRVKSGDLRVAMPGLARIQREQKDVLASVSQLDGVQVVECPDKQTGGDQDEKRHRDLGDYQNVLRAASRSAR